MESFAASTTTMLLSKVVKVCIRHAEGQQITDTSETKLGDI